jgi:hypothetical protein
MEDRDEQGKFAKGHSGNPKGRPKGALSINDELRKLLAGKGKDGKRKVVEAVAYKILQDALGGDTRLMIEMWQQMEGKPKQQIDVGGQEDNPIIIRHIRPDVNNE